MTKTFQLVGSELDSRRFGRAIGRVRLEEPGRAAQLAEEFVASDMEILVVRYPARHTEVFADLVRDDVVVIHADTLCYYEGQTGDRFTETIDDGLITDSVSEVSPELGDAVVGIFSGYLNHYAANPLVDASLVVEGYREWTEHHIEPDDQRVIVLREERSRAIAALAAITIDGETTEIDLAGVAEQHRGRGVYQHLLDEVSLAAESAGCRRIIISTQSANLPPIRAWTRRGWLPFDALETVHLVRRAPTWDERRL